MSFDPRHVKEANRLLTAARSDRAARRAALELQCRQALPELEGLDRAIQGTVAKAIAAALQQGSDPSAAVEQARRENLALQQKRLELLKAADIDPQDLEETPLCPICKDTGWRQGGLCQCVAQLAAAENVKELERQLDLAQFDFENFQLRWYDAGFDPKLGDSPRGLMGSVLTLCREYAQFFPRHPARNLFLYGGTGLGKTFLSGCIAKTVAQAGHWTVYTTAGELLGRYEDVKFNRDEDGSRQEDVRRYENCDLLVLDDLGSEMTTPFVQSALYQLLNQRMLAGKHTVISSNLDMDMVRQRYVPQVASRLEGEFQEILFVGRDIRLQKKEERLG